MKHAPAEALYAYWSGLKGLELAPRRLEIEPTRIADILPYTFILEKLGPQDYLFRIAGTGICDAFNRELRETDFLEFCGRDDRMAVERALAAVTRRAAVARFQLVAGGSEAAEVAAAPAMFDGILLPLRHTDGAIDRVLGALSVSSVPQWLGQRRPASVRVQRIAIEWPRPLCERGNDQSDRNPTGPGTDQLGLSQHDQADVELRQKLSRFRSNQLSGLALSPALGRGPSAADPAERQTPFSPHVRKARIVRSDRRQFRVYEGGRGETGEAED